MESVRSRLAAALAAFLVARLTAWGIEGITPELKQELERWLGHTFELLLLIGYALLQPLVDRRWGRTSAGETAHTVEVAGRVERVEKRKGVENMQT